MTQSDEFPQLSDTCTDAFEMLQPAEPSEADKGCVLQIYPASTGSQLQRLNRERTLIGRDPSCDLSIEDNAISRVHAAIDQFNGCYFLADLDSTNGTYVDDELLRGRLPLTGGELIRVGGIILKFMSSMDEEAQYHTVVHELMTRDSLTNAYNRSFLLPLMEKELQRSQKSEKELSVVLMDIDHFKNINDTYGHIVGDEVLRIFCERIRHDLRRNDMLGRFGGEEFVVACFETRQKEAVRVAERIRLAISSTSFQTQAGRVKVTCSLGVASSKGVPEKSMDALMSKADSLLYVAKRDGRNRVCALDPNDTVVSNS